MQLVAALLCDSATVREGLLHVLGGGITRMWRPVLPAPLGVSLALLVEMTPDEAPLPHEVAFAVTDPDGGRIADGMGGLQVDRGSSRLEPGEHVLVPMVWSLHNAGVGAYGKYEAAISLDTKVAATLDFWVLHPEEQVLPPLA